MSVLSKIFERLTHRASATPGTGTATQSASAQSVPQTPAAQASTQPAPQTTVAQAAPAAQAAPQQAPAQAQPAAAKQLSQVDVEAVLEGLAQRNPQKLNWRSSIVDLMKLLDLDSSLQERKALADELGYTGDKNDTATMNIWLHEQVMRRVAANGGKVPESLMH